MKNKNFYYEIIVRVSKDGEMGCDSFSLIDNDNQIQILDLLLTIKDKEKLLKVLDILGSPADWCTIVK